MLRADTFKHYIQAFNADDEELYIQHIPNQEAWEFLERNIPLFECPDTGFELTYYFRWWTYRKHIKRTPAGFVITEFLPSVPWAGRYNTISCAAGHHFYEGRWLHDSRYLNDYARFWFSEDGEPRRYSFWVADALYAYYLVHPEHAPVIKLLDDLARNYAAWEQSNQDPNGLFWQTGDRDGMEMGIGGTGYRPTINAYMYGDAAATACIAALAGRSTIAQRFQVEAERIRKLVLTYLWNPEAQFFKVLRRGESKPVDIHELLGYTPWCFNLPDVSYAEAWRQLMDPQGFYAPYGPTTAEQRHPRFRVAYEGHECLWDGPSWPYATAQTLTALANLLNTQEQLTIDRRAYFETLRIYTRSHRLRQADERVVPWIDENLNPYTGDWIARTRLSTWRDGTWSAEKGGRERGKDYNHSTYCDLIITGLIGLRPRPDNIIEVNPLLPADQWDYFCLDNVLYQGRTITVLWDRIGERYGQGHGLRLYVNGREMAYRETLGKLVCQI